MRIVLRAYDIDKVGYDDTTGYQIKPTQATDNVFFGSSNINRSQLTFKNINLMTILGRDKFYNDKTFNIKVVEVRVIVENGNNVIDYDSPAQLRTSNVMLSGLTFCNGRNENLLCHWTNFNPNEELQFTCQFNSGLVANRHIFHNQTSAGHNTSDFIRLTFNERSLTDPSISLLRYRVNSTVVTDLDNKIMRCTAPTPNGNFFNIFVQDAGDGSLPATVSQQNAFVTITVLPENNQWFHRRFTDNIQQDEFNNELTAYIASSHTVDLKFELRDILTDQLQPVITEPNGKVYPSLEFVLDIN
jgi:hypothetical protein